MAIIEIGIIGCGNISHSYLKGAARSQQVRVKAVADLRPPLHLPVVAGLAQGPGFPNLSCLGLLADRILTPYMMATA